MIKQDNIYIYVAMINQSVYCFNIQVKKKKKIKNTINDKYEKKIKGIKFIPIKISPSHCLHGIFGVW